MARILAWLGSLAAILATASADSVLKNEFGRREICGGVYGPKDGHGPFKPSVNVSFPAKGESNGEIAVIIFDYSDVGDIGFWSNDPSGVSFKKFMCDQESAYRNECSPDDLGKFVVADASAGNMLSERVSLNKDQGAEDLHFEVKSTGYYCVAAEATPGHEAMKFEVDVKFQNAFGHLPGADYPLILFHFVQCILYCVIMIIWTIPLILHRHSVLKVQKYISAMVVLMILEQFFVGLYYFLINKNGQTSGNKALLAFVAFWTSARLAFTFFLLLIVGCGYSVVHPSLGAKMNKCRLLGGALFVTSVVFSTLDFYEDNIESSNSWLGLFANLAFFPFVVALALNYYMVLSSLGETVAYLRSRKQTAKVNMYRKLTFILVGALVAASIQCVIIIIQLIVAPLNTFITHYWQYKWALYDGWPNVVFSIALMLIMFLWRPSKDNMRYAMSTQLSQNENDADEFEIGSLHASDDEYPDEEPESFDRDAGVNTSGNGGSHPLGAQRHTMFDAEANHGLSDLESGDEFEIQPEDRDPLDDEDPLVSAPSQQLRKHR